MYKVERADQRLQSLLPHFGLQLTFPHSYAMPPHRGQFSPVFGIPSLITFHFSPPETDIAFWQDIIAAPLMPVPETTVHKDYCFMLGEDDVRLSGKPDIVFSVAETLREQILSDKLFRFCVFAENKDSPFLVSVATLLAIVISIAASIL